MRIALCDDEARFRGQIFSIVSEYAEERRDKDISFEVFSDAESLLSSVRQKGGFDIYILDIVMPGMSGIALGAALREHTSEGKIIYLTSSAEYALDSFRVRAFDYILKPPTKEQVFAVLDEAISSIHIKKDKVLVIKTKEGNSRITFDSVLYAELKGRSAVYHLADGKTVVSTTLRIPFPEAVGELLGDSRFALCGASMVVNLHHVTSVETEGLLFSDTERVFLGKKACRELRSIWSNYWINEEG